MCIFYLVVSSWNGQYISSDRPADVPHHIVELVEQFGRPGVACRVVTRPDKYSSILEEWKTISHITPVEEKQEWFDFIQILFCKLPITLAFIWYHILWSTTD